MLKTISNGMDPFIGKIFQQLSFVHVKDVATAAVNSLLLKNAVGIYNVSIFCFSSGSSYYFGTVCVYKTSVGFQAVLMAVTSSQITLNLTSGTTITISVTTSGNAIGNFFWAYGLTANYTGSLT
jgi:hypothetical protein